MVIDIAILVLIVLGFLVGLGRGVLKSFLRLFGIAAAVVATVFLSGVFLKAVSGIGWFTSLIVSDGISLKTLFKTLPDLSSSIFVDVIYKGLLEQLGSISEVWVVGGDTLVYGTAEFTEAMLPYVAAIHAGVLLACLLLYFAIRIVLIIINSIVKSIAGERKKKPLSRLFGALLGLVNGALVAAILILIAQAALPFYINVGSGDYSVASQLSGSSVRSEVMNYEVDGKTVNEILASSTDKYLLSDDNLVAILKPYGVEPVVE